MTVGQETYYRTEYLPPTSQNPATGPYPDQFNPAHPISLMTIFILVYSHVYA
jgi:hypothetical protein